MKIIWVLKVVRKIGKVEMKMSPNFVYFSCHASHYMIIMII